MKKAQAITDLLDNMGYEHGMYIRGLYPTSLDVEKGRFRDGKYDERKKKGYLRPIDTTTFGAMGDSAFEVKIKSCLCFFIYLFLVFS
jgi:mannosyl-oligosaccharide alpha-1,2-mannosidase